MPLSKTILVVDDESDIRETLKEALEWSGYHVILASNGAEALSLLREIQPPNLIFLDLMMPQMNGYEFITKKNQVDELKEIPVVVISADTSAIEKTASLNIKSFIKKPIPLDGLLETAERYCT